MQHGLSTTQPQETKHTAADLVNAFTVSPSANRNEHVLAAIQSESTGLADAAADGRLDNALERKQIGHQIGGCLVGGNNLDDCYRVPFASANKQEVKQLLLGLPVEPFVQNHLLKLNEQDEN